MDHNELSMLLFETPPASPASGTTERSRLWKTALQRARQRSVNIHMAVHVVMCAEKCLWPLQLSVHFAAQLVGIVPTPAPLNKDFFFCVATLCPTHNASSRRCQAAQIKLGLNKMYHHPCMQKSSQQLTFLSGRRTPLKDYLSESQPTTTDSVDGRGRYASERSPRTSRGEKWNEYKWWVSIPKGKAGHL